MTTDTASVLPVGRRNLLAEGMARRRFHVRPHAGFLARSLLILGIACATWALALPSDNRALPVLLLSMWGVVAVLVLPMGDTLPVVLLCLSTSTAELPGLPLEEIGPLVVVALWVMRSLMGVLLRRNRQRAHSNASASTIAAVLGLLACNLVVMGYRGIAALDWVKSALPWLLCLAAYPASQIHWTQTRFARAVEMMALTGAMVSVADMMQFMQAGGIAGATELGGSAFVSMLPLVAIVAILLDWEKSRATVGSVARRLCLLIAFTACLARIVMSLQRAWLIGAVVGLAVWIWTGRNRRSSGVRRLASTGSLVFSVAIALIVVVPASQLFQDAWRGFVARIGRSWVGGSFDYSIGTRLVEVTAAMQSMRDSPWFGTGLGSLIEYVRPNGVVFSIDYIHIGPVFVLTKLGIVGLAVVGWLIAHVLSVLRQAGRQVNRLYPDMSRFLFVQLCVIGVLFVSTRYVFKLSNAALFWLLIGMALSLQNGLHDRGVSGIVTSQTDEH